MIQREMDAAGAKKRNSWLNPECEEDFLEITMVKSKTA